MHIFTSLFNFLLKNIFLKRRIFQHPPTEEKKSSESISICFAITVCDEHEELTNLLDSIIPYRKKSDEILIQGDQGKMTDLVKNVLERYKESIDSVIEFPLNNNFAAFKNNLAPNTSCQYIFQLDADEIPSPYLMEHLHGIMHANRGIDLLRIPRMNIMLNDDIPLRTWKDMDAINKTDLVNFPDYQRRIYKNAPTISWTRKIHEKIIGYKSVAFLPEKYQFCLLHCKHWKKQESKWGQGSIMSAIIKESQQEDSRSDS